MHASVKKIIIGVVAFLIAINFVAQFEKRTPNSLKCCDEYEYVTIAQNLTHGNGYSIEKNAPYKPTVMREPAQPLLLATFLTISPQHGLLLAQIFNLVLITLTATILWRIALRILEPRYAMIPPLLLLLSPRIGYYAWTMLSDILALSLLTLGTLALIRYFEKPTIGRAAFVGLGLGVLALSKMAFALLPIALLLAFVAIKISKKYIAMPNMKTPLFGVLLGVILFIIPLAPWIARNHHVTGANVLTVRTGQLLDERSRPYQSHPTAKLLAQYMLHDFFPPYRNVPKDPIPASAEVVSPYGIPYGPSNKNAPARFFALLQSGMSEVDADHAMVTTSVALIKAHPFLYLEQFPFEIAKFFYPEFFPGIFAHSSSVIAAAVIIIPLSLLYAASLLFGFMRLLKNRTLPGLLVCAITLYAIGVHTPMYVVSRYGLVIYPLLLIVATLGFLDLKTHAIKIVVAFRK